MARDIGRIGLLITFCLVAGGCGQSPAQSGRVGAAASVVDPKPAVPSASEGPPSIPAPQVPSTPEGPPSIPPPPGMAWIPGGTFLMGADDSSMQDAGPVHEVAVDGFWMD